MIVYIYFFFQAEDGIRDLVRSRGLGVVYKRQVYDFTSRINLRAANKRCVENLTLAGGLDCFKGIHRAQYFFKNHEKESSFLEKSVRYGLQLQNEQGSAQQSLFGGSSEVELPKPPVPVCEEWSNVYALNQEKERDEVYIMYLINI